MSSARRINLSEPNGTSDRSKAATDKPSGVWRVRLGKEAAASIIELGGAQDRRDALQVRKAVYCDELGYQLEPCADTFDRRAELCVVRTSKGSPIASLRILGPTQRPYEFEAFLPTRKVLPADHRAAEISRFCVLPESRGVSSLAHFGAFQFAFDLALRDNFSHFIIWSKPSLEAVYRYLLFEVVEGVRFRHPALGNETHSVMVLDLHNIENRYRRTRHPLASLLLSSERRL